MEITVTVEKIVLKNDKNVTCSSISGNLSFSLFISFANLSGRSFFMFVNWNLLGEMDRRSFITFTNWDSLIRASFVTYDYHNCQHRLNHDILTNGQ